MLFRKKKAVLDPEQEKKQGADLSALNPTVEAPKPEPEPEPDKPKRGPGRPKKIEVAREVAARAGLHVITQQEAEAKAKAEAKPELSLKDAADLLCLPFNLCAEVYGEYWRLDSEQKKRLEQHGCHVIAKWAPNLMVNWVPEILFTIACVSVFSLKIKEHVAVLDAREAESKDSKGEAPGPTVH